MSFFGPLFGSTSKDSDLFTIVDAAAENFVVKESDETEIGFQKKFLEKKDLLYSYRFAAITTGPNLFRLFRIGSVSIKSLANEVIVTTESQRTLIAAQVNDRISLKERVTFLKNIEDKCHYLKNPPMVFTIIEASVEAREIDCIKLLELIRNKNARFYNSQQQIDLGDYKVIGRTKTKPEMPYKLDSRFLNPIYTSSQSTAICRFTLSKKLELQYSLLHSTISSDYLDKLKRGALFSLAKPSQNDKGKLPDIRNFKEFAASSQIPLHPLTISLTPEKLEEEVLYTTITIDFEELGVAGLDEQVQTIMRETFLPRMLPKKIREAYGIQATRGMLLYGPPGTGKTSLAEALAKKFRESGGGGKETIVKIIKGPEVKNMYVGGTEENIRKPFDEARANSRAFHIIIFDEIDAIASVRSESSEHNNSMVAQLLTMIDGVDNGEDNFLVIGITNRKDCIDPALLRPGRCGTHVYVGIPERQAREAIFQVHTNPIRKNGLLAGDVDFAELAALTENYTGAEIRGAILRAVAFAHKRNHKINDEGLIDLSDMDKRIPEKVYREDLVRACKQIAPAHGISGKSLTPYLENRYLVPNVNVECIIEEFQKKVRFLPHRSNPRPLCWGFFGSRAIDALGLDKRTHLAVHLAIASKAPNVTMVSFQEFKGSAANKRCSHLTDVYRKALNSPASVIILEDIPRLLGLRPGALGFDFRVAQTLKCLFESPLPKGKQMVFLATFNEVEEDSLDFLNGPSRFLSTLGLQDSFENTLCDINL